MGFGGTAYPEISSSPFYYGFTDFNSFTEVAMILICSSLPLVPKFIQLLWGNRKPSTSYQQPIKSKYVHHGSGTLDSTPWSYQNRSISKTAESYVPLDDLKSSSPVQSTKVSGGFERKANWEKELQRDVEKFPHPHGNAILKTVRMESNG